MKVLIICSKEFSFSSIFRYAKFVDLEKNVLSTEEDALIQKVLTEKKSKRKRTDDDESDDGNGMITTTDIIPKPVHIDENDMKWAANYIEEQQTQLILSLLDANPGTSGNINDDDGDDLDQEKEQTDYKFLRPTLETMGIGK